MTGLRLGLRLSGKPKFDTTPPEPPTEVVLTGELGDLTGELGDLTAEEP